MDRSSKLTVAAATAAALMIGMDFIGVASVLSAVERDLGTDLTSSQWLMNLYALTFGMGLVTGGKLGDTFGHRRVLLVGLALFAATSLGVAVSQDIVVSIGFRGVQGIGGALIWPTLIAIAYNAVPAERSALAIGVVLGGAGFGNVLGPLLAGVFTEIDSWRLLFVVNIPVCLAVAAMVVRFVPRDRDRAERRGLDLPGTTALSVALLALLYSLDVGSDWGWDSVGVLSLWVAALVLFFVFWRLEQGSRDPLVPPELLRDRGFVTALLANGLLTPAWYSFFVFVPQYMAKTLGYSSLGSAAGLLPGMVVFAVLSPIAGQLYERAGPRRLITVGYAGVTLAALNMAIVQSDWGYAGIVPALLLIGFGAALTISSAGTAAVASVDEDHSGSAGGLSFMSHLVFGAAGVAVATALFTTQASESAVGAEFVEGLHLAMWFCAAIAALGIVNARRIEVRADGP